MIFKSFNFILSTASIDFEKSARIANIMFYIFLVLALITLVFGVFCFIKFNIPRIIGDLSGRNAKKSIEQMRAENEKSGKKSFRPHPAAVDRGTLTEQIKENKKVSKELSKTKKTSNIGPDPINDESGATDVLDYINATTKLEYNANDTETLSMGTEVLSNRAMQEVPSETIFKMKKVQDIVFIHTKETI